MQNHSKLEENLLIILILKFAVSMSENEVKMPNLCWNFCYNFTFKKYEV